MKISKEEKQLVFTGHVCDVANTWNTGAEEIHCSSLDVARRVGMNHDDLLQTIERLECPGDFHGRNFVPASVKLEKANGVQEEGPVYLMTHDGFCFLMMCLSGREANLLKLAFIASSNAMEKDSSGERSAAFLAR